jgi:hypothetical protein
MSADSYALLTKVLDPRHVSILDDWMEFVGALPVEIVVYARDDRGIDARMNALAEKWRVAWRAVRPEAGDDVIHHETAILQRMVERTAAEYLLLVTLDALPFRAPESEPGWLPEVIARLKIEGLFCFSACGVIFRGDRAEPSGKWLRTQRFSNNCGLIARRDWSSCMERFPESLLPPHKTRMHPEWALEKLMGDDQRFGLRRLETPEWRVFHVQQWDERLLETRALFRRGVGIQPYLNRVWEDLPYPEAEFYNYPLWRRLKGRLRSSLRRRLRAWR